MTIMMRMSAGLSMRTKPLAELHVVEAIALAEGLLGLGEARVSRRVAWLEPTQTDDVRVGRRVITVDA